MSEDEREKIENRRIRKSVRRWIRLAACVLAGAILLFALEQGGRKEGADDPTYEWTLQFPGTPPGAMFKAKREDNLALVLRTILPADESPWKTVLEALGEVEITLSVETKSLVSLGTRVKWLGMDGRWRHRLARVAMALPSVRLRMVQRQPPAYEVWRSSPADAQRVGGPFEDYGEAKRVAVAEVERIMDRFDNGEKIKGTSLMLPADRP